MKYERMSYSEMIWWGILIISRVIWIYLGIKLLYFVIMKIVEFIYVKKQQEKYRKLDEAERLRREETLNKYSNLKEKCACGEYYLEKSEDGKFYGVVPNIIMGMTNKEIIERESDENFNEILN